MSPLAARARLLTKLEREPTQLEISALSGHGPKVVVAALRRAGIDTRAGQHAARAQRQERIRLALIAGHTPKKVAELCSCSRNTVYGVRNGLDGADARTANRRARLREHPMGDGATVHDVARSIGETPRTVRADLEAMGLELAADIYDADAVPVLDPCAAAARRWWP